MAKVDLRLVEGIAWLLSKPKRIKIAVGGRGSAKSIGVSDVMLMCADMGERVCCTREFQNSIDESVHDGLEQEIERLELNGFEVLSNKINTHSGGTIFYKGLARNITSLKSLSGVNKLWIEEGESVSEKSLKVLTPSIRSSAAENAAGESPPEIWVTMNRGSKDDAIAKKYLARAEAELIKTGRYEDDLLMVVELNYTDNPWFPPELEQERLDDLEHRSPEEYRNIWGGSYYDGVENAIIKQEWFDAAIDAHLRDVGSFEPVGQLVAAHDPSDKGKDAKGYALRHGSIFLDIDMKEDGDVNDGCRWALNKAIAAGADMFTWDSVGVGAGLKQQITRALDGKRIDQRAFGGGESPDNPDIYYLPNESDTEKNSKTNKQTFKNLRAQHYWLLRDRFYNTYRAVEKGEYVDPDTMISLSSDIPRLNEIRSEICRIPKKENGNGLIQIMSKPEMLKLEIKSPNMADAMMMAMITPPPVRKQVKVEYSNRQINYG
jgi:phage terminase large subunit